MGLRENNIEGIEEKTAEELTFKIDITGGMGFTLFMLMKISSDKISRG